MDYPGTFVEAIVDLTRNDPSDPGILQLLERVAALANEQLEGCDMAGVTAEGERGLTTAVFTDAEAPEIDQAQYVTGEGPCVEAFRTGEVLRINDTAGDSRWPEFSATAQQHGVRSTLSLPLRSGDEIIGALNLYSRTTANFAETDQLVPVLVAHAASALSVLRTLEATRTLNAQLEQALSSRAVIEQAKGILMGRHGCDPDAAFTLLTRESQATNVKVRDLAGALVESVTQELPVP